MPKENSKDSKYYVNDKEYELDSQARLAEFASEFELDRNNFKNYTNDADCIAEYDKFELVYHGTGITRANRNSKSNTRTLETNVVVNLTSELIESKIDISVPDPKILSKKPGMDDQADMIKEKILSDMSDLPFAKITDVNERNTYMHGIAISVMNWNIDKKNHEYIGEKEILNYHPKQVIPQSGIYDIDNMNHITFVSTKTADDIMREYGVEVSGGQEYTEYNEISHLKSETSNDATNDLVMLITRFYKDEDNDVCKFSWVGSDVLEDLPKYYYPRVEHCKECGYDNAQGTEECKICKSKKLNKKILTKRTILEDIELSPITYKQKQKKIQKDEQGQITGVLEQEVQIIKERVVPSGTVVDIPIPKEFPIAIRINVPYNYSFRGRSDVELLNDIQESHKKVMHRIEEKILKASAYIKKPTGVDLPETNILYGIIEGNNADLNSVGVVGTQINIQQDIEYVRQLKADAQSIIGISPSYQGKYDSSAKSGKAKEISVAQSASILQGPTKNKYLYYTKLFDLMFRFDLAFTQEKRPYVTMDSKGNKVHKAFDRNELLVEDEDGKWYYDTDFIFRAEKGSEIPNDKQYLYQELVGMAQSGLIDSEQFWKVLSSLDFPMAAQIYDKLQEQSVDPTQAILSILQQYLQMEGPQGIIDFMGLPPDEQMSIINQVTGKEGPINGEQKNGAN